MVMAESERESRPESSNTSSSSNRLQWLRQRREQLQEKLIEKNNELKNLCIEEAELTGVLPPEIPLDPGENPPVFRRRVGTSFAYPQNIINKIKSSQAQEESALELERQIQIGVAKTAFNILNDPSESKAIRRKQRLLYQQSQRRLKELDTRLSFIRQGYGRVQRKSSNIIDNIPRQSSSYDDETGTTVLLQAAGKHRLKKPRPPLDSTSSVDLSSNEKINCDNLSLKLSSGVDQSTNDWYTNKKENSWMSNNISTSSNSTNSINNDIHLQDINDNPDVYVLSDQRRPRTYSHGNNDEVALRNLRQSQMVERSYRTVPRGYNPVEEDEPARNWPKEPRRQFDAYCNQPSPPPALPSQSSQHQQQLQHPSKSIHKQPHKYHRVYSQKQGQNLMCDNQSIQMSYNPELFDQLSPNSIQSRARHTYYPPGQYPRNEEKKELQLLSENKETLPDKISRRTSHENITMYRHEINQNDNWIGNVKSESGWPYQDDFQPPVDKFGSIDRRKQNNSSSNIHRYRDTNQDTVSAIITPATPPSPRYFKHSNSVKESKTNPGYLTNHPHQNIRYEQLDSPPPPASRMLLRTQSLGSVETWHSGATSTPGSPTTVPPLPPPSNLAIANQLSPMSPVYHRSYNADKNSPRDTHVSYRERENEKDWYKISMDFAYNKSIPVPQKNLEIPAESNKSNSNSRRERERERDINFEATNLAQNDKLINDGHTIIHAGKYQPYKEVTKPFEMSDFYKYSTKFRKKMDQSASQGTSTINQNPDSNSIDKNKSNNNDIELNNDVTIIDNRQKILSAHVPVAQRTPINSGQMKLPSQSYIAVRDDNNIRDWSNNAQKSQPTTKDSTVI